jgi:protein TonB
MKILVLCILISSFTFLQAQKIEVREIKVSDQENVNVKEVGDSAVGDLEFEDMAIPLAVVEQVPLFSSCEKTEKTLQRECFHEEMKKHVEKHMNYPQEARENKVYCKVFVEFEIEKDGKVSIERVKSNLKDKYGILFETEAKRIINELPNFIPAMQRGKVVKVRYVHKIEFNL